MGLAMSAVPFVAWWGGGGFLWVFLFAVHTILFVVGSVYLRWLFVFYLYWVFMSFFLFLFFSSGQMGYQRRRIQLVSSRYEVSGYTWSRYVY